MYYKNAVSYTHLDVYKRQFLNHGGSEAIVELDESYGVEEEARRDITIPGYGMQIEKIRPVTV